MSSIKKLRLVIVVMLVILGFLAAEILKLTIDAQRNISDRNLNSGPIGNLSDFLTASQEKDFLIVWEDKQKNIRLGDMVAVYRRQYTGKTELRINFDELNRILKELAPQISQEPVNAKFAYSALEKLLKEFTPPQNGYRLDLQLSSAAIAKSIAQGQLNGRVTVSKIAPKITLDSLTKLGITSLLAQGESNFDGSSSSRRHNIEIGAAKFQEILLKPGEEFSFNQNLGEVGAKEGYHSELVIKNGKLISEYGGGICQVSTTLFRAATNSGLLILERRPHSFPVRYYNPQGFDATIYPGVTDLRFKNDTGRHILIQNHIKDARIVFEIFGSSDGRKVEMSGPQILEQNDNGAMKTLLTRKIIAADGAVKTDSFWSSYKSPAAFPLERNPLE